MAENRKKRMGFGLLLFAGFFLFNPQIGFTDILPDCVGYLLLMAGLNRLCDLNDRLEDCLRPFRMMFFVSLIQLAAEYLIYGYMQNNAVDMNRYEQPVTVLLCSFVLLVLSWYFLIPAFRGLFEGIGALAERYGAERLTVERKRHTPYDRMRRLSSVFVIVQTLFGCLPETAVLTALNRSSDGATPSVNLFPLLTQFRVIAAVLSGLIGLIWLCAYLRFFLSAQRDTAWRSRLADACAEQALTEPEKGKYRRLNAALILAQIGFLFTVPFQLNHYPVFPGVFCAVLITAGVLTCGAVPSRRISCCIGCIPLAGFSVLRLVLNLRYLERWQPEAALYQENAYRAFLILQSVQAAEALSLLLATGLFLRYLYGLYGSVTGVPARDGGALIPSDRFQSDYRKRIIVIFVFEFFTAVGSICFSFLQLRFAWMWIPPVVCAIAGIICFSGARQELLEQFSQPSRISK